MTTDTFRFENLDPSQERIIEHLPEGTIMWIGITSDRIDADGEGQAEYRMAGNMKPLVQLAVRNPDAFEQMLDSVLDRFTQAGSQAILELLGLVGQDGGP